MLRNQNNPSRLIKFKENDKPKVAPKIHFLTGDFLFLTNVR